MAASNSTSSATRSGCRSAATRATRSCVACSTIRRSPSARTIRTGTQKRIQQNQLGLKKGYDPYDSGQLVKKEWKKKKDLRKLSDWIKSRKPKDE